MTPQQIDAMKLALEWFKCYADHSMSRNNAEALADEVVEAIEKALADHAMRETQRLGQEIEPDDIASILACRDMLDAQPVPEVDRVIWPEHTEQEPVANRAFLERTLIAMEGVIDVADRKTDEFDALRACIIELTLMLYTTPPKENT